MRSQDEEDIGSIVTQVGIDKGKRKQYQREYYKKRKEDIKIRRSDSHNMSESEVAARKESRKEYNRWYYLHQKEKKRLQQIANGEGCSHTASLIIQTAAADTTQRSVEQPARVPLGIINESNNSKNTPMLNGITSNVPNKIPRSVASNKENIPPRPTQLLNGEITQGNPTNSISPASHRKMYKKNYMRNYMRNYQQQSKQKTGIQSQGQILLPLFNEAADIEQSVQTDPYDFIFNNIAKEHHVLKQQRSCVHCGSLRIQFEFPSFCCMEGKTRLAYTPIPGELYRLFTSQDEMGIIFRKNIRSYNTNFSFTSMGVNLDKSMANMTAGVYTFRAHGGIYHRIDQLVPRDGHPRYLQLYFYDAENEFSHRLGWPNLNKSIVEILTHVLAPNPYVKTFRSLAELGPLDNYRVTLNASVEVDQRVYNRPTTSEVAGIWVEGNDNITAYKRSIIVYGRSEYSQQIQPYFACYDPLAYPLFFPNGESGWHSNILRNEVPINQTVDHVGGIEDDIEGGDTRNGRDTVSMREYYAYKFQIRSDPNVLLLGGRLLQQYVVDIYIKIETSRLRYFEQNQTKIRADLYQGVVDCVNAGEVCPSKIGQRIVLPASFIIGPRDMRRRFLDAMTLVQDDGKPDIFLTMTCNPGWKEITDQLEPGQSAQDRPELITRVFRAKLEALKKQLFEKNILGEVEAYVYVIEFQKHGLPHAHFLLIMKSGHKMTNPDHYDKIVCAEIPDPVKHKKLHDLVVKHMMHGPCGKLRPDNPCMEGEPQKCRFHYPRQFNETTVQGDDSYPLYRRRNK